MNTTYYRLELRRILRDPVSLFFTVGLPGFLYLVFGAQPDYANDTVRDGNVAMWIMIAMAGYGAMTATSGLGGAAAIERMQGWSRQLGLTPLRDHQYVGVKAATAVQAHASTASTASALCAVAAGSAAASPARSECRVSVCTPRTACIASQHAAASWYDSLSAPATARLPITAG